jgi:hypothetical protein
MLIKKLEQICNMLGSQCFKGTVSWDRQLWIVVFVAYRSTNFPNGSCPHDQHPSCQCSQSRFYNELLQTYGTHYSVENKLFFKTFLCCPNGSNPCLRIGSQLGWIRIFIDDPNPWKNCESSQYGLSASESYWNPSYSKIRQNWEPDFTYMDAQL